MVYIDKAGRDQVLIFVCLENSERVHASNLFHERSFFFILLEEYGAVKNTHTVSYRPFTDKGDGTSKSVCLPSSG